MKNNSSKCNDGAIRIVIQGLGHVPAKKNSKAIVPGKGKRKSRLITKPEYQQWIQRCTHAIVSQLFSGIQTSVGEMSMADSAQFLMSLLPSDDNWVEVEIGFVRGEKVDKGQEGAVVIIERNQPPYWKH